ncbi:MAG TPA: chemotaxis response regulator protein-glutamate methylesterase [Methylomusa anaerophila]|nr:chemotaxis response regulator protein-glutamate methylesterase [Methylomusa anaerophila]HML87004.1 chemotaxis response regulator protein-glutamate methylesterase [Methylomusa anaerophila]
MIRVLIVDDSVFMRKLLTDLFAEESDYLVVDTARNGREAIDKIRWVKPDVITLDVEMPVLNGIQALETIMRENPTPVVMISSLTQTGAEATLKALELGAVDFVAKAKGPIANISNVKNEILMKCRAAAKVNIKRLIQRPYPPTFSSHSKPAVSSLATLSDSLIAGKIVAIGASTGGPRALQDIITNLPGNLPCGILVVQHMPPGFTKSLAERLNSLSALAVKEAEDNDIVLPGLVLIAPGDYHMTLTRERGKPIIKLNQNPPIGGHRPAVDPMLESVAQVFGNKAIGVILTGMGHDGSKGLRAIKDQHGYTIAEDQSTAVVFGMPKAAIELGVVDKIAPVTGIAAEIVKAVTN